MARVSSKWPAKQGRAVTTSSSEQAPSGGEIVMLDAYAMIEAIRAKRLSCREVMAAHLDQIEAVNGAVNAIVSPRPREDLLAEAEAADADLARGHWRGPLHGLPHAVKDLAATRGLRTTFGSPLFADFVPGHDALFVERLRAAGAILIGKTNVPEFGLGSQTYNPVFGSTGNAFRFDPSPPAAVPAAPPWPWRCAWCRSPMAAISPVRCAIRPGGTASSASGPRRGASPRFPSRRATSSS